MKLAPFSGDVCQIEDENVSELRTFALLRDVFKEFRDIAINIDVKIDNDELLYRVSFTNEQQ